MRCCILVRYPELNLLTELGQVYMQRRASKYVEKSNEGKNPTLNKDVVENLLKELGQLYAERITSKSVESPKKRWCCCC